MQSWFSSLNSVSIDFDTSEWYFPHIVITLLLILGAVILMTRFRPVVTAIASRKWTFFEKKADLFRLLSTFILIPLYFYFMDLISGWIPNMGMGFLLSSIPFVFLLSMTYCHDKNKRNMIIIIINSIVSPLFVWYVLYELFNVSLA